MSGRPLRFLGGAAIGWVGWRVFVLWPATALPPLPILPMLPRAEAPTAFARPASRYAIAVAARHLGASGPIGSKPLLAPMAQPARPTPDPYRIALAMTGLVSFGPAEPVGGGQTIPPAGLPAPAAPSRWSGSAWMVLRGGQNPPPGLTSGQLGGGQAGIRVAYALGKARRVSLVSRLTSPTSGPGREASLGVEWQPTRLPVRLVIEHRAAIDGGHGGPGAGVIGGFGPLPLPAGFTLESYAQAGAIRRVRTEPYADGAIRLARPIASIGPTKLDIGMGLSGGAQRDAARLDIGPSIGMRIPLIGRSARLSLDWRQRVGGRARPGSGVTLTLGSDF